VDARVVAILVLVALAVQASPVAGAQEEVALPRHPPVLIPDPVQPVATIIADRYDLAYLARLGAVQAQTVASQAGEGSQVAQVVGVLNSVHDSLIRGDWEAAFAGLNTLKTVLVGMNASDLQLLASHNTITLPACRVTLEQAGTGTGTVEVYYAIENRYEESNPYALCVAPTTVLELYSALDTSLSLLSVLHNKTVAPGVYVVVLVHIPPEAAYPEVVQAVAEGRLTEQLLQATAQEQDLNATVQALLEQVATGDQQQALEALRQLLELARAGLIDWDIYAAALRTYQERFGEPPQFQTPDAQAEEEVNVDLNELLRQMQGVVEAAEKARLEAGGGDNGGGIAVPNNIAITPPDPAVIALGGLMLAAALAYKERERILPKTALPWILAGRPPAGADVRWCYRALIEVLSLRGVPKQPWETPEEFLARVRGSLDPEVEALLEELTEAYEKTVYGEEPVEVDVEACARRLRGVMLRWRGPKGG